jgi:hypothetical protein
MTLNKKNLFFSNWLFLVLLVSFIYAVAMGYGLYGFGNDYYAVYSRGNLVNFYNLSDRLGYIISTLTIFNIYLGVYISSFLLAFSLGTLLSAFFKFLQLYSLINFLLIFRLKSKSFDLIVKAPFDLEKHTTSSASVRVLTDRIF